ncbi:Dps family protein [Enterococcus faecalis]|uniref:Dps family protein n=4 Tax=Enterococcus TaxID=1350 RepID=UPI0030C7BBD4
MKFEKTKEILNQLVADLSQFSVVIHQTHWYMRGRGPEFLTLHPQMDEYMDQINEQLDVVSERLITLDGSPFSTLREFAENTKIEDEIGNWDRTIPERMEKLVAGYRYLADLYAKGIEVSGEEGDDCTQDIFIANKTDIEKNIWMLQAKLGKAPGIDA